jgi:GNAT superfamily N-acetyltransferase
MTIEITRVQPSDKKTINAFYKLWEQVFGAEELEPKSITVAAMNGEYPVVYRVYVAKDGNKVVGVIAGGMDYLVDDQNVLMIGYAATHKDYRKQGIQRTLFNELVKDASADSTKEGKTLSVITSEATEMSVPVWGKLGLMLIPVNYIQPALDFDESTGLPADGAGEAKENLMLGFLTDPSNELISKAVEAIYRWSHRWPREDFDSDEAYAAHVAYVDRFQREFDALLAVADISFGLPH